MKVNVTRELVMDLLPAYLSGEASPDTRTVVDSFLEQDPQLAERVRIERLDGAKRAMTPTVPPELELKAFRRTRRLLVWQKWSMGFAMFFTALTLSIQFTFSKGRIEDFHFLARDHPVAFAVCAGLGVLCWFGHLALRQTLRSSS
jgi:hypothetical protein